MASGDVKIIRDYFGMSSSDMIKEWKALPEADKEQIRNGIIDGTETY